MNMTSSGADSMGHGGVGTRAHTFTNGWARGTVSKRTANKKLTKLH